MRASADAGVRAQTMDPRAWVCPEGEDRVTNAFETPLCKLIIACDVRLERWENADHDADRQALREEEEDTALARFCNKFCGCCQPEKQLVKPKGAKAHNQRAALQKKRMLGRSTLDDIDIPDFYNSPPTSPAASYDPAASRSRSPSASYDPAAAGSEVSPAAGAAPLPPRV